MPDAPKPITGRCLCGAVTYRADAEPVVHAVCHCADCQRQTGNPFSVVVAVPRSALSVEGSTLASFATNAGKTERTFCSACGSPIFSAASEAAQLAFIEAWTSSAQPWSPHFEGTARLEHGPQA